VRIRVDLEGRVEVHGMQRVGVDLVESLFLDAELARDGDDADSPSRIAVRFQCHRDAPFRAVREVMRACGDPTVRILRIQFAVRHPKTGAPGCIAARLPAVWKGVPPAPPDGPDTAVVRTSEETTVGEVVARLVGLRRSGFTRAVFRDAAEPDSPIVVSLGGE
jgi:hypothetical protein